MAGSSGIDADVIVIGGGPGGSTAASMMAAKDLRVLLLEREHFPRDHIGESLLPASIAILDRLGVVPAMQEAGFLRKWGATMVWGTDPAPWSWYFRETNQRYPHSYQVWRPLFDKILLDNTRSLGVDVREGHQVTEVLFEEGRAVGVRFVDEAGAEHVARARHIVDASGQIALLGQRLNLRKWDPFFQNLAVYAYFEGTERLPEPDDTNIFIESYSGGWFWHIPLHTGWMSVGAVVDSREGQEGIRRTGGLEPFLREQIALAPNTSRMLRDARLVSGPTIVKDWSYISDEVVGEGFTLVGDAACFVDPLFSSGVHLALTSGLLAAAYVVTVLKDPTMAGPAGQVYKQQYYRQYYYYHEAAKLFYTSNRSTESYFWEARRIIGDDDRYTPRESFIRTVAGQPPQGYERAVLEHGEAPVAFRESVDEARAFTIERRAQFEALARPDAGGRPGVLGATPRIEADVSLVRQPVLAGSEFVWGNVIIAPHDPDGTPVIEPIARVFGMIDGKTSVGDIIRRMSATVPKEGRANTEQSIVATMADFFVQGVISFDSV